MRLRLSLPPIFACEDIGHLQELALDPSDCRRDIVFYDENILGYVVLESSNKDAWQNKVIRLVVSSPLESGSSNALDEDADVEVSGAHNSSPYALCEASLTDSDVVLRDFERGDRVYTMWKFLLNLKYPNFKLPLPLLSIDCFFESVVSIDEAKSTSSENKTLPDYMPVSGANLLSELRLGDHDALKVPTSLLKVAAKSVIDTNATPESPSKKVGLGIILPLLTTAPAPEVICESIQIPVLISLGLKLRSAKPTRKGSDLLTSVTIEASDELSQATEHGGMDENYFFKVLSLDLLMRNGTATSIPAHDLALPSKICANETFTLTYQLTSNDAMMGSQSNLFKRVTIVLKSQLMKRTDDGHIPISGEITTDWAPYVDFGIQPPPINSALKQHATASQSANTFAPTSPRKTAMMMRTLKQKNIQVGASDSPRLLPAARNSTSTLKTYGANYNSKAVKFMPIAPSSSSVTVNLATGNNSVISGLKISFLGKFNIALGTTVEWVILATNTSNTMIDATLIMSDTSSNRHVATLPNSSQVSAATPKHSNEETIDILYSRAQLNNAYQSEKTSPSGILVLDNDLRIGPLEPRQVCERTLRLAGVTPGIFNLRGLKVIDTHRGSGVDFGKLVEVFVI